MLEDVFIDRFEELKKLEELLQEAKIGKTGIVFLCGESGLGKYALAQEFLDKHKDFFTIQLNCTSTEKKTPFSVVSSMLNRRFLSSVPDPSFKPRIKAISENLKGVKKGIGEVETDKEKFYTDFVLLFSDISKSKPMVVFIDNYQWADRSSVALFSHMANNMKNARVMIIAAYSPELEGDDVISESIAILTLEGHANVITIERFDEPRTKEMLEKLFKTKVPDNFSRKIFDEAKGNPFYVKALLESLMEEGLIDPIDKNFANKVERLKFTLPKSVMELTMKRIQQLDKESQEVLKIASVLGTRFRLDVLARILKAKKEQMQPRLSTLVEHRLIYQDLEAKSESYVFEHVKLRDILYKQMGKNERRELHRLAGNAYEKLLGESSEFAYALAHHYSLSGLHDKAHKYAKLAGDRALHQNAPEEAVRNFQESLKSLGKIKPKPKPKLRHEILVRLGDANFIIGKWKEANRAYKDALKASKETGNKVLTSISNRKLGELLRFKGEYTKAKRYFETALAISKNIHDSRGIADCYKGLGYMSWRQGDYQEALDFYEKCIVTADSLKDDGLLGIALLEKGNVHNTMGDLVKSMEHYKRCLVYLERTNNISQIARVYNNMGDISLQREEWSEAIQYFERSRAAAEKVGGRYMVAWSLFNEAEALTRLSRTDDALKNCHESLDILNSLGDKMGILAVHRNFAIAYGVKKDWEKAEENFNKSLEMAKELNIPDVMAEIYLHRARMLKSKGESENAKKNLELALKIAKLIKAKRWIARIEKELEVFG